MLTLAPWTAFLSFLLRFGLHFILFFYARFSNSHIFAPLETLILTRHLKNKCYIQKNLHGFIASNQKRKIHVRLELSRYKIASFMI